MKKSHLAVAWLIFSVYALLMLYLLFWQRSGHRGATSYFQAIRANYNLVPFKTVRLFAAVVARGAQDGRSYLYRFSVVNLLGNVAMFVPLGLLLPVLLPGLRLFWRFLLWVAAAIIAIELIQLFTLLGICDIDDLILNLVGATVGFWIYKWLALAHHKKQRS